MSALGTPAAVARCRVVNKSRRRAPAERAGGPASLACVSRCHGCSPVPGLGRIEATLINAGNPTVFVAASLGLNDTELRGDVNGEALLARAEAANLWALVRRRASQATISAPSRLQTG